MQNVETKVVMGHPRWSAT